MLTRKRIATLAVMTAATIAPSIGAQVADATVKPVDPCQLKWILAPAHSDLMEAGSTFDDLEHQTSGSEHTDDPFDTIQHDTSGGLYEAVDHDDLSYSGC